MRLKEILPVMLVTLIFATGLLTTKEKSDEFPVLKGRYLGKKPPGELPEAFAPSIIFSENKEKDHEKVNLCLPSGSPLLELDISPKAS